MLEDISIEKFINKIPKALQGIAFINSYEFETFKTSIKPKFSDEVELTERQKQYFLFLLLKTTCLNKEDKKDILFNKLEKLSEFKIKELIEILEDEKRCCNLIVIDDINTINDIARARAIANEDYFEIEKYNINNLI